MNKICKHIIIPTLLLLLIVFCAKGQEIEVRAREYNGVMIYRVPYNEKINTTKIKLYPHYMPLRAKYGWTYVFVDLGHKLTNPVIVEEIPVRANHLIGKRLFGERAYIVLEGKGYTEIRKDPKTPGKGIYWEKGDAFTAPHGYWVGHANPYGHSARILSFGVTLTNDILNPDIEMATDRPKLPYLLHLLPYEEDDVDAGEVGPKPPGWPFKKTLEPLQEFKTKVYRTTWGTSVNLYTLKTSRHLFPTRAAAGWKSAHIELGGRVLNWFIIQDLPPMTIEIGHKHGGEVIFLGLKGRGTMAFREKVGSPPESKIYWGPGDLFCLPQKPRGVWHSHSNPYAEPARLLASFHLLGYQLLDPFTGQVKKDYNRKLEDHVFAEPRLH